MSEQTPGPRLELKSATRRFGELVAVSQLDVVLEPGRVHGLIGENGAGKSTALKMLAGHLEPSDGQVLVEGEPLAPATPQEAISRGIGMVHQHFMLVDSFAAIENLVLGAEPTARFDALDLAAARRRAARIGAESGLEIDLERRTDQLSVGERQRLEILRVLYRGARAILLDEPTAVLSPIEVDELYRTLRQLADGGATIVVVTHRLDEVVRFCDHVTVMRRGARVLSESLPLTARQDATQGRALIDRLTRAIMGGEVPPAAEPPDPPKEQDVVLDIRDITVIRPNGTAAVSGVSLTLTAGEVVGVAGVEGNGQRELARALAGLDAIASGAVELAGRSLLSADDARTADRSHFVRTARARGLVVVHEDRHRDELLLEATIADNLVVGDLGEVVENEVVPSRFSRFDVYPRDSQRLANELSGGNQQKVVMARALDRRLVALVLAQPTRGVDVGTARTIHHAVAKAATDGAAVLIISADLNELRSLSHRIIVMRKGRIAADLDPSASDETIGRAMLGTEKGAAA